MGMDEFSIGQGSELFLQSSLVRFDDALFFVLSGRAAHGGSVPLSL
jgi:hypothetical protein